MPHINQWIRNGHPVRLAALVFGLLLATVHAEGGDYRLGPGDMLKITVFASPELSADLRVSQSGIISYPYLGEILVTGLSTGAAEKIVAERLVAAEIIKQPQVSILVTDYQSQLVSVMGQVNKPGQYALATSRRLIDLLAQAGGIASGVAGDQATLLRADGSKLPIDLQALFSGDGGQNLTAAAGDTIYVPKAPQFYIYGEVQRPGVYRLERNMTVSQALSAGGGLTPRGSGRRVVAKRKEASGKEAQISVRGSDTVLADDVLMVRESLF